MLVQAQRMMIIKYGRTSDSGGRGTNLSCGCTNNYTPATGTPHGEFASTFTITLVSRRTSKDGEGSQRYLFRRKPRGGRGT